MHLPQDKLIPLIYSSISAINQDRKQRKIPPLDLREDTILFGRQSKLDSLDLVTLIVDLEQRIKSEFNVEISLSDENAMSQNDSPFQTVKSLAAYISGLEV